MNNEQKRWISKRFTFDTIRSLPISGSQRHFFRIYGKGETRIVILDSDRQQVADMVEKAALFRSLDVDLPEIYDYSLELGVIIEEDLGDRSLENEVCDTKDKFSFYYQVVDTLVQWQKRYDSKDVLLNYEKLPEYDFKFARSESRLFEERFLKRYLGMKETDYMHLSGVFEELAARAVQIRKTLIHLDFQARNIMWRRDKPFLVDYQAAMLGPYTYDLAALVYDNHVELNAEEKAAITRYFSESYPSFNIDDFYFAAVQRTLQAVSAYAFFVTEQGKMQYEKYIEPGLRHLGELSTKLTCIERLTDFVIR